MNAEQIEQEVVFSAQRSRGPGGQHVNKTASAAQLNWKFMNSLGLNEDEKQRIRHGLRNMINNEDELYVRSDEFRELERNKKRCLEKLFRLLRGALHVAKKRKATRPTYSSKLKRLESKARRSEIKRGRRGDYD